MNTARLFRRLKRDIGPYGISVPVENLDKFILDILEDTTIPVFSIYNYREEFITCSTSEFEHGYNDTGENCELFILPQRIFEGREILYVRSVEYASDVSEYYSRYSGSMSRLQSIAGTGMSAIEAMMLANAEKPIVDGAINPITFKYIYPRKLYIWDALLSSRLKLTLACEHDTSMQTITPSSAESFYKLALLDVEAGLYNIVKPHENIKGAYDEEDLKIDAWREAAAKREELLKEWDELYGLDQGTYEFG